MLKFDRHAAAATGVSEIGSRSGTGSLQPRILVVWALLLAGIIAVSWGMLAPGAEAHGEVKVLVSNVDQARQHHYRCAQNSQAFTTGSNPAGLRLE